MGAKLAMPAAGAMSASMASRARQVSDQDDGCVGSQASCTATTSGCEAIEHPASQNKTSINKEYKRNTPLWRRFEGAGRPALHARG